MKIIDLTRTIEQEMPVYPGTEPPILTPANTIEQDGFRETLLSLYSHTGTHMDAPAHVKLDGVSLDQLPLSHLTGRALVVDCSSLKEGEHITMQFLAPEIEKIEWAEFVLFYTGWSRFWGTEQYFGEFPVPDDSVIRFLVDSRKKGIGMDAISIEPISAETLPHHHEVLGSGMVIIENLVNLELVGNELFTLFALPLKWKDSDGAPVRAAAVLSK